MDLVGSYSSNESESESEVKLSSFASVQNDSKELLENIVISDSDPEIDERKSFEETRTKEIIEQPADSKPEKIDFLNLDGSDIEDEQQDPRTSVQDLLNAAAILSDIECGPQKAFVSNPYDDYPRDRVKNEVVPSKRDNPFPDCRYNTKHFRCDIKDNNNDQNDGINNKIVEQPFNDLAIPKEIDRRISKEHVFRTDERIAAQYNKRKCATPKKVIKDFAAHTKVINELDWCSPKFAHLLLSASADGRAKIWDIYHKNPIECFTCNSGLKAAKWMLEPTKVVYGGYDKCVIVADVESGKEIFKTEVGDYITSLQIHPIEKDVILSGSRNVIHVHDLRSSHLIRELRTNCEEVLDMVFLNDKEVAVSTNVVSQDSADRTIMVWDYSSGTILSNQVFLERYTCPSLKVHPTKPVFIAQTNGDYIAFFSKIRPYKMLNKRIVGHSVSGYGVECDFSSDGKYIVSGDANGNLLFYGSMEGELLLTLNIKEKQNVPINRVRWNPMLFSTVATAAWDGCIQIWQ
ncbi:hypothetical protein JTE90_026195 [Oedothorax gibbosus]|uniref:Uncharacterized protein n=1 Tax=Oedothorax gibbosus TaxID=931172 RepID=A0AAV6U1W1_9ARAC|nr:hypothetical protein JTE90_026195 [Oedothorax gibbosus]